MTVKEYMNSRNLLISSYNRPTGTPYENALCAFNYRYVMREDPPLPTKKWQEFDALVMSSGTGCRTIEHIVNETIKLL